MGRSVGRTPRGLLGIAALLLPFALTADNPAATLLNAAAQGRTREVEDLIGKGASTDARDKNGRTPLMLAAQRGHPDTVTALLTLGADPAAKDRTGSTAWVLAMFDTVGSRIRNDDVIQALPSPPKPKIALDAGWNSSNLYSSCSVPLATLTSNVGDLQPDLLVLAAFHRFAERSGRKLVTITKDHGRGTVAAPAEESFAGADAVVSLVVRPAASCQQQQSGDSLGLTIELQVVRAKDRAVLVRKLFGGGIKGLHARTVTSQQQYFPIYQEMMQPHIEDLYQAAVEAWFRSL